VTPSGAPRRTFWFTVRLGKIPANQIVVPTPREDLRLVERPVRSRDESVAGEERT